MDLKLAIEEVRTSASLYLVLNLIRTIGNHLNAGTARGNAIGFDLDVLPKLHDVKGSTGRVSLLEHITRIVYESYKSALEMPTELSHVTAVAKADIGDLERRIATLVAGVQEFVRAAVDGAGVGAASRCR